MLAPSSVGVADIVGAASMLCSQAALAELTARALGAKAESEEASGLMEHAQVIIRPVVSEKSYVLAAAGKYTFRIHPDAHKTQVRQAVEALFDVHVVEVRTMSVKSKPKRRGISRGRTRTWKKAIVQVRAGETIPIFAGLEGSAVLMPIRKPKPTSAGMRFVSYPDFAEITKTEPERSLVEGLTKSGGRNSFGRKTSRHRGGGAKRLYRRDRLQAPQGRRAGARRGDRVRPQPHRLHRAAALRRRREALHPGAGAPDASG